LKNSTSSYLSARIRALIATGSEGLPLSEQRVTRLINAICIIILPIIVVGNATLMLTIGFDWLSIGLALVSFVLISLPWYLNAIGKPSWSKGVLLLVIHCVLVLQHFFTPYALSSWIIVVTLFPLYVALFESKKLVVALSTFSIGVIMCSIYFQSLPSHQSLVLYLPDKVVPMQIVYFGTTSFLLLLLTIFIKSNLINHQKRLEELVEEKEVLLKEVHHRVKNNLQVIYSLLNLQERRLSPGQTTAREVIESGQSRIHSMALVHEQLYQSSNFSAVSIKSYIQRLVDHIAIFYAERSDIRIICEVDDMLLPLELTVPVGLIINEAVSNSYKHASYKAGTGKIEIIFHEKNGHCELTIKDNGVNNTLPSAERATGIGVQLISDMTHQLGGQHRLKKVPHWIHHITFPI